ncbi:unnamed protein product [Phaeothamnion confervicola]
MMASQTPAMEPLMSGSSTPTQYNADGSTTQQMAVNLALLGGQVKTLGDKALTFARSRVTVGPFRPPKEFFGLGEAKAFGAPAASELAPRLRFNLPYFSTNYGALYLTLVMLSIITSPLSLCSLALLAAGWYAVTRAQSNPEVDTVALGPLQVSKPVAYAGMLCVSVLCGSLLLGSMFSWPLWVGAAAAAGHAALREHAELAPQPQMTGDFDIDADLSKFIAAGQQA